MFICCRLTLDWQSVFDKVYTLWILPILFRRLHNKQQKQYQSILLFSSNSNISLNNSILALLWLYPWHKWDIWSGLLWLSNYCDGNGGFDGIDNYIADNKNNDYDDDDDIWMRQLEWSIMREWFIAPPPSDGENKGFIFSFFLNSAEYNSICSWKKIFCNQKSTTNSTFLGAIYQHIRYNLALGTIN